MLDQLDLHIGVASFRKFSWIRRINQRSLEVMYRVVDALSVIEIVQESVNNGAVLGMVWFCRNCHHSFHPQHALDWFKVITSFISRLVFIVLKQFKLQTETMCPVWNCLCSCNNVCYQEKIHAFCLHSQVDLKQKTELREIRRNERTQLICPTFSIRSRFLMKREMNNSSMIKIQCLTAISPRCEGSKTNDNFRMLITPKWECHTVNFWPKKRLCVNETQNERLLLYKGTAQLVSEILHNYSKDLFIQITLNYLIGQSIMPTVIEDQIHQKEWDNYKEKNITYIIELDLKQVDIFAHKQAYELLYQYNFSPLLQKTTSLEIPNSFSDLQKIIFPLGPKKGPLTWYQARYKYYLTNIAMGVEDENEICVVNKWEERSIRREGRGSNLHSTCHWRFLQKKKRDAKASIGTNMNDLKEEVRLPQPEPSSSGPTFIKLGQWASTRRDIFNKTICDRLSILHTNTRRQRSFRDCETVIDDIFGEGFLRKYKNTVFINIEPYSIGSGCIAQVYKATISVPALEAALGKQIPELAGYREKEIAIKVTEKGMEEKIGMDLSILRGGAYVLQWFINFHGTLTTRKQELDSLQLYESIKSIQQASSIYLVQLSTHQSKYIRRKIALLGMRALLKMIFVDNFIHGDLHPGNILIRFMDFVRNLTGWHSGPYIRFIDSADLQDEPTLILLDAGIVIAETDKNLRNLKKLFKAVLDNQGFKAGELLLTHLENTRNCQDPEKFCQQVDVLVNRAMREKSLRSVSSNFTDINFYTVIFNFFHVISPSRWKSSYLYSDELLLYITATLGVVLPGIVYFIYHKIHKIYMNYALKKQQQRQIDEAARSEVVIIHLSSVNGPTRQLAAELGSILNVEMLNPSKIWAVDEMDVKDFATFKQILLAVYIYIYNSWFLYISRMYFYMYDANLFCCF
uniref:ABC1 domain-containing protein n=1 Tax=Heterorhabditis bacteriophora TaxID=37862 RepID=A0A1I7W764_HETBA